MSDMHHEFIGPRPGEWRERNPSAEELFDVGDGDE